ncbi:MAG: prepilin-type N-terminal cleavage/methylation domain-containing protein [Deltaproteobacteria bacterium]|nr:prepilin-type N-terminal cleavage/methylation domain-containing protein [Deltaproteobacteria bacterium]
MRDARRKPGFTLIEVMVSLVVFMIALLGLIALQRAAIVGAESGVDNTTAVNVGRFFLTELENEIATWPENPPGVTTTFPSTTGYPMLRRAVGAVNDWHLLPVDDTAEVDKTLRIDNFLGTSDLEGTARFCVNFMATPMDTQSFQQQDLANAMIWKLRVRVAWPKPHHFAAGTWKDCTSTFFDSGGARIEDVNVVELVAVNTRELAR